MTTYTWPGWAVSRFEMRVMPNTRVFTGSYTPNVQAVDMLGARWYVRLSLVPAMTDAEAAAREAFFDRLVGQANSVNLWHLRRSAPLGTLTAATTSGTTAQFSNTIALSGATGATLLPGDQFRLYGMLHRVMAPVTFASGAATVEVQPRTRQAVPSGQTVALAAPVAAFILKPGTDNVPTTWAPGMADGAEVEFIEAL